jgi:hypothetical protein
MLMIFNLMSDSINTIKEKTENLLGSSRDVGLEINAEKTKYMIMSRHHNSGMNLWCRDSSVGIALGYGLDDRGSMVQFPAGAGNFSLHHRVQNGSGDHPASYPMGTWG